ncbi:NAD(P)/FAD-dependent oxidoreductase [Georgenia sp. 10Sc9-8]|uniref:NAD(P)/FAD-dependent oxidoreductase n=1 Tax=Georgenia halotolerans TaxID=3028317 RepID=A0ABT5TYV7_9MICO|nr:NAD(P)/FAD-dependent oxidoreductase [Georgenia halotolerans]
MADEVDVVILGMGPGGETAAGRLLSAGLKVAVVEQELIGGECAYWACIPSKTVLRPAEASTGVGRAAGAGGARLDWAAARDYRDDMVRHLDDGAQADGYAEQGALVVRGHGALTGPGTVQVGDRRLTAAHVIVATGAQATVPPIEGLDQVTVWTNREAYSARDLPERATVVGGSAVGLETSLFLARFGTAVTLLHRGDRLLDREEPAVGELAEQHLADAGVEVRTGTSPVHARRAGSDSVLELDDGSTVSADVVVMATGRRPRTDGLGLESVGVTTGSHGEIPVDAHCRAGSDLWAVGDVTGVMPFTHVAKYQGRVVADAILGRPHPARYDGIPRVVFTDPEIAAVGLTRSQADEHGLTTREVRLDLTEQLARPWTYEQEPRGELGLLLDTERDVLVGAWAVAPQAGEWIHQAALAIRAAVPREVLLDQVAQFPTYSEGYQNALEALDR